MPPKVRELIKKLEKAGFQNYGGKGSHRNFWHEESRKLVVISGNPGDDARHYQIKAVETAIKESRNEK